MFKWFKRKAGEEAAPQELSAVLPVSITADEFAARVREAAPAIDDLTAQGLDTEDVESVRQIWECHRVSPSDRSDALLDLCYNFDLSTFQIADIQLEKPTDFDADHLILGYDDVGPLVYPKSGGQVVIRDHEDLARTPFICGRTGDGFLKALVAVAEYVSIPRDARSKESRAAVLAECLSFAGRECESFYSSRL